MNSSLTIGSSTNKKFITEENIRTILYALLYISVFALIYFTVVGLTGIFFPVWAADTNAFKLRLESGIYRDNGETNAFVELVLNLVNIFLQTLLPIISILTITWILLSLISTLLYLQFTELFDAVYVARREYKSEKRENKLSSYLATTVKKRSLTTLGGALGDYGILKCIIIPDVKSMAFSEASENGAMSPLDFLKMNGLKYMIVIAFAMLISDQTLLDLLTKGGDIGVYFIEKLAYDYDYVQIIDNVMTLGSDYSAPWDTSSGNYEGKNKTKVYNKVYALLKTGCNTTATRSTEFKAQMGRLLVEEIEQMSGVPWERKTFVVSAELLVSVSNPTTVEGESYYFNVAELGFPAGTSEKMSGYIHIMINSEEEVQNIGVYKNTYAQAWGTPSSTSITFDITKYEDYTGATVNTFPSTATVQVFDGSSTHNLTADVTLSGNVLTISWANAGISGTLKTVNLGKVTVTTNTSGTKTEIYPTYLNDSVN